MRRFTPRLSPATVIACIALMVALGGTGYAATSLPANSVGTTQLKSSAVTNSKIASNAVTSTKVKNHSLLGVDFASGQIPRGPRGSVGPPGPAGAAGARGPTGPAGAPGSGAATQWALVGGGGGIVASSGGVSVQHPATGNYYVTFSSTLTGKAILATQALTDTDSGTRGGLAVTICGGGTQGSTCAVSNNASTVHVLVNNNTDTGIADHTFYVAAVG
jgi:hypothetical protein